MPYGGTLLPAVRDEVFADTPQPETTHKNQPMAHISPQSGTVSTLIRSYKSAVTKHANRLGLENEWQNLYPGDDSPSIAQNLPRLAFCKASEFQETLVNFSPKSLSFGLLLFGRVKNVKRR